MSEPGISNRQSKDEEERDRQEHPPIDKANVPPEDAGEGSLPPAKKVDGASGKE